MTTSPPPPTSARLRAVAEDESPPDLAALAEAIAHEHALSDLALRVSRRALRANFEHARRAGKLLLLAKDQLTHGQWEIWVEENLPFKKRTAQHHMSFGRLSEEDAQRIAHLGVADALKALAEEKKRAVPPESFPAVGQEPESAYVCPHCSFGWSGQPRPKERSNRPRPRKAPRSEDRRAPTGPRVPYSVPSMAEVEAAVPPDAPTVISLFSGAGGSCLGFRMAGFRTLAASEFIPAAAHTYRANFPGVPLLEQGIREVTAADLLAAAGVGPGEVDVLEGSPPCSAWSAAGRGQAGWGKESRYSDTRQRTDDLFFEFARILDGVQPRAFVAENVPGLAQGASQGYFKSICDSLRDECGYLLAVHEIDAMWLGVPQHRERLIFIGMREDVAHRLCVGPEVCVPVPQPYRVSIREALATLPEPDIGELRDREAASIEGTSIGPEWHGLAEGGSPSGSCFNLIRAAMDEPCPTITATAATVSSAGVTHPREPRKFTPAELKALASFPHDFELTGTFRQRSERIGRAVPPFLMRAVATRVRAALDQADAALAA